MKIYTEVASLQQEISRLKKSGHTIGFVPTMGALHDGHLSLVSQARNSAGITVASIFVNPKQFNDPEDLRRYPRTPEKDAGMLEKAGCDILFMPDEKEMYPPDFHLDYKVGYLDELMEGKHRKGHFQGVVTVVYRLFMIVQPDMAFFGEKDYQQYVIIRKMAEDLHLPVQVIPCPIIREPDGLAMSSRNQLLTPEHRAHAPLIARTMLGAREKMRTLSPEQLKQWVAESINQDPYLELEYFEVVDSGTLLPVNTWNEKNSLIACIAVWAGKIRLIDNLKFSS